MFLYLLVKTYMRQNKMPELPEVETVLRTLENKIKDKN